MLLNLVNTKETIEASRKCTEVSRCQGCGWSRVDAVMQSPRSLDTLLPRTGAVWGSGASAV